MEYSRKGPGIRPPRGIFPVGAGVGRRAIGAAYPVPVRLYNTLTREVEEVRPLEEGTVRMYTCGPTVYRPVHIGNLRTLLLSDLVRRGLELEGYRVIQVVNITDVGHMVDEASEEAVDRMELAMEDEGLDAWQIAERYTRIFMEDIAKIGILSLFHVVDDVLYVVAPLVVGARPLRRGIVEVDVALQPRRVAVGRAGRIVAAQSEDGSGPAGRRAVNRPAGCAPRPTAARPGRGPMTAG